MKKHYPYLILLSFFGVFTMLILKYRTSVVNPELPIRAGQFSNSSEWINIKTSIENLLAKVRQNPADMKSKTELGFAYIQEGRISGNHAYYDVSALSLFEDVLKGQPNDYFALTGKATVLLSQHHFSEAIPLACKAKSLNPFNTAAYGILTDALVETGDYKMAIQMADSMTALRPDLRSYARISYLREIMGDYSGAIEAMKMAVEAGYPGMEQTEWCRMQLGQLYENIGNIRQAEICYDECVYYRSTFAFAYAGKARIQKAQKNYDAAIQFYRQAQSMMDDFSFQQELTEIYRLTNQQQLAAESARRVLMLLQGTKGDDAAAVHGHYADRELSIAYLDAYDYSKAYFHAQMEYNRRPENVDVCHTLAWVSFKMGKYDEANKYIDGALKTNSKNPVLNFRAGLIRRKAGMKNEGEKLMQEALSRNPYLSALLTSEEAKSTIALN